MYNQTLHRGRKYFCYYYLHFSKTPEILGTDVFNNLKLFCFKINDKQMIKMPKNVETTKFENYEKYIKSPFMIYTDSEIFLMPENKKKQKPDVPYKNKYQIHTSCSHGYN